MKSRALLAGMLIGLTLTATTVGYAAGRAVTVRPGVRADFPDSDWSCTNVRGRFVRCFSGDAYPYVTVGGSHDPCKCVKVKVYMLSRAGRVARTYERGRRVYVFTG